MRVKREGVLDEGGWAKGTPLPSAAVVDAPLGGRARPSDLGGETERGTNGWGERGGEGGVGRARCLPFPVEGEGEDEVGLVFAPVGWNGNGRGSTCPRAPILEDDEGDELDRWEEEE